MKKIIASLLAGICTLSLLAGCQGKGDQLVMGLDDSFPPMGFRDEADELVGFDIDLAKAVADKMGVELKMQPIILT